MYTFKAFIDEQRKNQSKVENKQNFNVLVLFGQYIDWVLAKQAVAAKEIDKNQKTAPHQMTAAQLLFQIKVINAYQAHYANSESNSQVPELTADIVASQAPVSDKTLGSVNNTLRKKAAMVYEVGQAKDLAKLVVLGAVAAGLVGVYLGVFGGATPSSAAIGCALAFVGFTFLAVAKVVGSEMLGDKKAREQAFDKANHASIAIRTAVLGDEVIESTSAFELALNATTSVMLKSWKGAYATQTTAPAAIDLKQVKAAAAQKVAA